MKQRHPGHFLVLAILCAAMLNGCIVAERSSPGSVMQLVELSDTITATGYAVIELQLSDLPEQRRLVQRVP